MIQNIVFDMGDVLLDFDTRGAAAAFAAAPGDAELLYQNVFQSPWWIRMDRGGEPGAVLEKMLPGLPERLHGPARQLMDRFDDWLIPNDETNALAKELAEGDYALYLLSNIGTRFYRFQSKAPAIAWMRGRVLSCEEGLLKPDPAIYRRLFERYSLNPETCFFIDDSPPNIETAWHLGMAGFCFRGDVSALRRALRSRGVNVELK